MRVLFWVLGLVLLGTAAFAAGGGSASSPLFVRMWQGDTRDFREVTCTTTGDVALVSAAQAANAMSMYFYNTDASNYVTLCPRTATAGACNAHSKGITLKAGTGFTSNVSVEGPWSCISNTGSVVVEVYIERDYGTSTAATPTPIPTP